jgi:RND family efflux transporter MFP subunit
MGAGEVMLTLGLPQPYQPVAPNGAKDDYRCFLLDPGVTAESFITGVRFVPGNPDVVHHAIAYRVEAGQVLAVFATETVQAGINQAKAALNEAKAVASETQANADRARALQPSGVISAQQFNQYLTAEATAKARVESAQAGLAVQELLLRQTQVKAPDSGVISSRTASVGAVLGVGTELFRLVRGNRLEWRADLVTTELFRVKPGQKVRVSSSSQAEVIGTVRMVAPTVDVQNRTGVVYVDLPASALGVLKPGMFTRGEFEFGSTAAKLVPQQSVVVRDGFQQVFAGRIIEPSKCLKVLRPRRERRRARGCIRRAVTYR